MAAFPNQELSLLLISFSDILAKVIFHYWLFKIVCSGDRDREDIVSGDGICEWGGGLWLSGPPRPDEGERGKGNFIHFLPFYPISFVYVLCIDFSSIFINYIMYFNSGAGQVPSDCVRRPVLPPEEDHPQGPEGREPATRQRDEHQDCWFRFQQRVRDREQVGYILRVPTLCRAWAVPGKEIRWTWGWCLVSWCDTLYSRWGKIYATNLTINLWNFFERFLLQSVAACPLTAPPWGNWGGETFSSLIFLLATTSPPALPIQYHDSWIVTSTSQGNLFVPHFPPTTPAPPPHFHLFSCPPFTTYGSHLMCVFNW